MQSPVHILRNFFKWYGRVVDRYYFLFIVVPLLLFAVAAAGLPRKNQRDDLRQFIPTNARIWTEYDKVESVWPPSSIYLGLNEKPRSMMVVAKPGKNILDLNIVRKVEMFNSIIMNTSTPSYYELCKLGSDGKCLAENKFFGAYRFMALNHEVLTYPVYRVGEGSGTFLGNILGGVETLPGDNPQELPVKSARTVMLFYICDETKEDVENFDRNFLRKCKELNKYDDFDIYCLSKDVLESDVRHGGDIMTAKLQLMAILLFCCMVVMGLWWVWVEGIPRLDMARTVMVLMVGGLVCAAVASITAFGFMFWANVSYSAFFGVIPFLIVAVSIDDAAVLVHAYRRSLVEDKLITTGDRLSWAFEQCGVPVLFTSLTSIFAYLSGLVAEIPMISLFAAYAAVACAVNFFFLTTLFAACFCLWEKLLAKLRMAGCCNNRLFEVCLFAKPLKYPDVFTMVMEKIYVDRFLVHTKVQCVLLVINIALIVLGGIGIPRITATTKTDDVVPTDSRTAVFERTSAKFNLSGTAPANVIIYVNRAPSLHLDRSQAMIHELLHDLEDTKFTQPSSSTVFWKRQFERDIVKMTDSKSPELWSDSLYEWSTLSYVKNAFGSDLIFRKPNKFDDCSCKHVLQSFRISIGLKPTYLTQRTAAVTFLRSVMDKPRYRDLDLVVIPPDGPGADQALMAGTINTKSMLTAACTVLLLTVFMISDPAVAVWVVISVASVDICILGLMGWLGVRLTIATMIVLFTSVGVSVDYTIHVASAFSRSEVATAEQRLRAAMQESGLPVVQSAITTIISVSSMIGVNVPQFSAFTITFLAVVTAGFVHAIVFLPAELMLTLKVKETVLPWIRGRMKREKKGPHNDGISFK